MTFAADEASIESSEPREGIEIILPAVTYRLATGTRNVVINGQTFTAYPSQREEVRLATSGDTDVDLTIRMPLKHAFPQRYLAQGVPPRRVFVKVWRLQKLSGEFETIWRGFVTSMAADGQVALIRVPDQMGETLSRRLPTWTVGRKCPYVLYDADCKVPRPAFTTVANVIDVNGRAITVDGTVGLITDWATAGAVKHVASGEEMTIQSQIGFVVTMQRAIYGLKVGDIVEISAGCTHLPTDCRTKFSNMPNYGGAPNLPGANPYQVLGIGVGTNNDD